MKPQDKPATCRTQQEAGIDRDAWCREPLTVREACALVVVALGPIVALAVFVGICMVIFGK